MIKKEKINAALDLINLSFAEAIQSLDHERMIYVSSELSKIMFSRGQEYNQKIAEVQQAGMDPDLLEAKRNNSLH